MLFCGKWNDVRRTPKAEARRSERVVVRWFGPSRISRPEEKRRCNEEALPSQSWAAHGDGVVRSPMYVTTSHSDPLYVTPSLQEPARIHAVTQSDSDHGDSIAAAGHENSRASFEAGHHWSRGSDYNRSWDDDSAQDHDNSRRHGEWRWSEGSWD